MRAREERKVEGGGGELRGEEKEGKIRGKDEMKEGKVGNGI